MDNKSNWIKLGATASAVAMFLSSCMTTYDAQGRPVQSVDPGAAAVGAVALGAAAYAIGKNNSKTKHHYHRPHYRPHHRPPRYRYR